MNDTLNNKSYLKGFIPYALVAFLIGFIGGLTTVLGPAFVKDINIPYNNTTWTALSLSISSAVFTPILGKLSDVIGRRKTLILGIVIYLFGNILTAISNTLILMIIARFIVGVGTAAIAPTVISYIIATFPPKAISKGFALYMLISSSAVIFGPSIGGIIVNKWDYKVLMWICVGIISLFLVLCTTLSNEERIIQKKNAYIDKFGFLFMIIFFSLLLSIPSFGQNFGFISKTTLIVSGLTILSLIGLLIAEKKAEKPALTGEFIFRVEFILSIIILFLTQGLMQANMTNIIVFVNYINPTNNVISGYAISIMYVGMSLGSIILGPLADKYEPKRILLISLFLTAVGCGIMILFNVQTSFYLLALSLGFLGLGLGANATIFMKVVLSNLPLETVGSNTGIYGLFRDLTVPFGVAIFVPLFTNKISELINKPSYLITEAEAAVKSIHNLSIVELIFILVGFILVMFLPKIHNKKENINET